MTEFYTSTLGAGLGIIDETRTLLDLWHTGMNATDLNQSALLSGRFPNLTARRLKNLVLEGFAARYLGENEIPARYLKGLSEYLNIREFEQLLFLYTCRTHKILSDFVREVYWDAYSSGRETISIEDARNFVIQANQDGKTASAWSDNVVKRVSSYLPGACADFGLLEDDRKGVRKILSFRIEARIAFFLTYDLHIAGHGDNSVLSHSDWALFGMDRNDVLNELKRQALKGWFIIQSAGDVTRIGWQYQCMEELINALVKG